MEGVNVLVWDIETSPLITYTWGAYESNALEIIQDSQILCFAYKWLGQNKTYVLGQDDDTDYKPGVINDFELVQKIRELFDKADIVVAHNGNSFDQKIANTRMMYYGMTPPSSYQQIDTKRVAKKYGRFTRNKLDDLGRFFKIGEKMHHEGWDMWQGVLNGDKRMWKMMKDYCKQDVVLEEQLYLKLRPWMDAHPSISVIGDMPDSCPKCGSDNLRQGGFMATKTGKRKRYQCLDCGGWCSGRLIGGIKPEYIN